MYVLMLAPLYRETYELPVIIELPRQNDTTSVK